MRPKILIPLAAGALLCAGAAMAQPVIPNHLDCRFDDQTQALVCPSVLDGRSAAQPVPAPAEAATPNQGTAEWNAACAAKYRSFDAATGLYKSFSGEMKPCR